MFLLFYVLMSIPTLTTFLDRKNFRKSYFTTFYFFTEIFFLISCSIINIFIYFCKSQTKIMIHNKRHLFLK